MKTHRPNRTKVSSLAVASILGCAAATGAFAGQPGVSVQGTVAVFTIPAEQSQSDAAIDYVNARPMDLPKAWSYSEYQAQDDLMRAMTAPSQSFPGKAGYSPGSQGDGRTKPVYLGKPAAWVDDSDEIVPQEIGTSNHPFTTARADATQGTTNKQFPYRASGKLFFTRQGASSICSASLIKKGLVVTAAHCVAEYGQGFHSNFRFAPGYKNGVAPYGNWTASQIFVVNSYVNGTDSCAQSGVICKNDVAVIRLSPQNGKFPGTNTGTYGYGWNGYGFTNSGLTHVTSLGYPLCLDNAQRMERTDSYGFVSASQSNNTLIGSLMCGGSSGGPWLNNFGQRPQLTGTTNGSFPASNTVIGVTSWGSNNTSVKQQGASPFLSTNIVAFVNAACGGNPNPC